MHLSKTKTFMCAILCLFNKLQYWQILVTYKFTSTRKIPKIRVSVQLMSCFWTWGKCCFFYTVYAHVLVDRKWFVIVRSSCWLAVVTETVISDIFFISCNSHLRVSSINCCHSDNCNFAQFLSFLCLLHFLQVISSYLFRATCCYAS